MVDYNPKEWWGLIFRFHKSDTFRKMFTILLTYAIGTAFFVYLELNFYSLKMLKDSIRIHALLGFVIGLLLVFRTNSAYDRWWEGRKQWGTLVNVSRNFLIKLNAILPENDVENRKYFARNVANFSFALKEHLRKGVEFNQLELSDEDTIKKWNHVPNAISTNVQKRVNSLHKDGLISGDQLINLDNEMRVFTDVLGACERIKKTPIPFSYNLFIKKFIFLYTTTLPFGMAYDFQYWTIPIATSILYIFGSLELLAEEIEDPFGNDSNDLPLDEISSTIKKNLYEIIEK